MKKRLLYSVSTFFAYLSALHSFGQVDEVKYGGSPSTLHNRADSGLIIQDTAAVKVYSYVNSDYWALPLKFDFDVDDASDILDIRVPVDKCIKVVNTGAIYKVQSDSVNNWPTDSCYVIPTKNGNYAVLQEHNGGINVDHLGAQLNATNLDDAPFIQKALDLVMNGIVATNKVILGPYKYIIETPIIGADQRTDGGYNYVNYHITGNVPVYSTTGAPTRLEVSDSCHVGFVVQKGRQITISNIAFEKETNFFNIDEEEIILWEDSTWESETNSRMNRYSPTTAIAIDAFDDGITGINQYPQLSSYYTYNGSVAGTSQLTIEGCSFVGFYMGIANNPSSKIANGDNIRVANCHAKWLHTFYACGQTQSRGNSIDNIYAYSLHTFVSGESIGKMDGTPPALSNLNIAHFTKMLLDVQTNVAVMRVSNSYMEGLWSLGNVSGKYGASFHQCQIKFNTAGVNHMPPYHARSGGTISFVDCMLGYYTDCANNRPLFALAKGIDVIGGYLDSGTFLYSDGETNTAAMPNFSNTFHCFIGHNLINPSNKFINGSDSYDYSLLGGKDVTVYGWGHTGIQMSSKYNVHYRNPSNMYNHYEYKTHKLDSCRIDSANAIMAIPYKNVGDSGLFKVNDVLFSQFFNISNGALIPDFVDASIEPLGRVKEVKSDSLIIEYTQFNVKSSGNMTIYAFYVPRLQVPMFGDFIAGNDTIFNVENPSETALEINSLIRYIRNDKCITPGTYIKTVNTTDDYIVMSMPALATDTFSLLYDAPYVQTMYAEIDSVEEITSSVPHSFREGSKYYSTILIVLITVGYAPEEASCIIPTRTSAPNLLL